METVILSQAAHQGLLAKICSLEAQVELLLRSSQKLEVQVKSLDTQHQQLVVQNQQSVIQNQRLSTKNNELVGKNIALEEKLKSMQHRLFGKKKDQVNFQQRSIIKLCLESNDDAVKQKVGRKAISPDYIPDEVVTSDFKSTPDCPNCHGSMHYVGTNDSYHHDYEIIFKKVKLSQAKYACRCCNKIVVAQGSKLPIPKGVPLPGLLARAVLDKFSNATPAYRQAQNYSYANIIYSRQQLCNWYARAADLVEPLIELMVLKILASNYIMADETPLTLLNKTGQEDSGKGYLCIIKEGGRKFNFVHALAIEDRCQEIINAKLLPFKGHLQTDGLNFYFGLHKKDGIIAVACWAHVRRKFIDIVRLSNSFIGVAGTIVRLIKKLYAIERKGAKLTAAALLAWRQKKALPILNKLKLYMDSKIADVPPKSSLGVALKYTLERWDALCEYSKHPEISIDNNACERCIKYLVIGRKNWLFADNINSAQKLAMLYSLVITCKFNNVNPQQYLEYIFSQLPYINKHNQAELEQLLPDRYNINKRFDDEYRERNNIIQTTNIYPEIYPEPEIELGLGVRLGREPAQKLAA